MCAGVPEWSNGADSKSDVHEFESHHWYSKTSSHSLIVEHQAVTLRGMDAISIEKTKNLISLFINSQLIHFILIV